MEHPIKIDDLGGPLFSETSIYFLFKQFPDNCCNILMQMCRVMLYKFTVNHQKHLTLIKYSIVAQKTCFFGTIRSI